MTDWKTELMPFGKNKGKTMGEIYEDEGYCNWLAKNVTDKPALSKLIEAHLKRKEELKDKYEPLYEGNIQYTVDPVSVKDVPWVIAINDPPKMKHTNSGKWMLFYHRGVINREWQRFVFLHKTGKLPGVHNMRCSTDAPSSSGQDQKVIMFNCDNSEDEKHIMSIGVVIAGLLKDYKSKKIHYKGFGAGSAAFSYSVEL